MQDKLKDIFKNSPKETAAYVHVPFCARTCAYCKFYKTAPSFQNLELYLQCLEKEASRFFDSAKGAEISSIFIGGGTPSILSENQLSRLAKIFERQAGKVEWTIEASPSTINPQKLKALKSLGINRISLGVQSFSERTLKNLGRPHKAEASQKAIEQSLEIFDNVNIDLIFGAQNQTREDWHSDLEKAASFPLSHISAYCLEFESATSCCAGNEKPFETQMKEADFLYLAMDFLAQRNFKHYEISNYAKPGKECAHNLNTWNMNSWIGFGPSAASQFGGFRFRNTSDLNSWAKGVMENSPAREDIVKLDDDELFNSAVVFGLRKMEGVNLESLKSRFKNADFSRYEEPIKFLVSTGLLEKSGDFLRLSREGIPLADSVAVELL